MNENIFVALENKCYVIWGAYVRPYMWWMIEELTMTLIVVVGLRNKSGEYLVEIGKMFSIFGYVTMSVIKL